MGTNDTLSLFWTSFQGKKSVWRFFYFCVNVSLLMSVQVWRQFGWFKPREGEIGNEEKGRGCWNWLPSLVVMGLHVTDRPSGSEQNPAGSPSAFVSRHLASHAIQSVTQYHSCYISCSTSWSSGSYQFGLRVCLQPEYRIVQHTSIPLYSMEGFSLSIIHPSVALWPTKM